jgi:Peptidase M15
MIRPLSKASHGVIPVLFLLILVGCAKHPVVYRPFPAARLPERPFTEVSWTVEVNGQKISPLVPTVFLLPGEPMDIRIQTLSSSPLFPLKNETWAAELDGRPLTRQGNRMFFTDAPQKSGLYHLKINGRDQERGAGQQSLLVIVLAPFSRLKDGFIDQFPMGFYPDPEGPLKKTIPEPYLSSYLPPRGFIEVTEVNQDTLVSQHFRLKDFDCHDSTPYPHYLALSPALLLKLELLTLKLQARIRPGARLIVLSGFRTPWHNREVSAAPLSRHIYGDAADVVLGFPPSKETMDGGSHNGNPDSKNAAILIRLVEEVEEESGLSGGLGLHGRGENGNGGTLVHIDARGFKARW